MLNTVLTDIQSPEIKTSLRKAWQKMKRTLPSQTRQHLVTREMWEIFLVIDGKNQSISDKEQSIRNKMLEKNVAKNESEHSSLIEVSNEEGNLNSYSNWNH